MWRVLPVVLAALFAGGVSPAVAQRWNDGPTRDLVARAVARRQADQASGLRDFRARAHGFVFFLAQLGEEQLAEPPHLIKSDQLELEVYWNASGGSKQRIIGWRDRVDLPTDIRYHRDHLGIVQNGFADRIRLGEGDEVRDVPHPLAGGGTTLYDFAIVDSLTMQLPGRTVRAVEVTFRPKDLDAPRIVGSMFLDAEGGELVQVRFNFTRSAYLDESLEDITILLENALWAGRWWLPRRQEIEIRRRSSWLDLPARGIIRGRWEIGAYEFNTDIAERVFLGPEIMAAPRSVRDTFPWVESIDRAIAQAAGPIVTVEMDEVRGRVREIMEGRLLHGLPATSLALGAISDLLHVNRVEGLAPGIGVALRPGGSALTARMWASYGFSDERFKGRALVEYRFARATVSVRAAREIRDVADEPVISPLLNSILAQEFGHDYGDYVLAEEVGLGVTSGSVGARLGVERTRAVAVRASPATGTFRVNPALGSGTWAVAAGRLATRRRGVAGGTALRAAIDLEGGRRVDAPVVGEKWYARLRVEGSVGAALGGGRLVARGTAGWGSIGLPPHRTFVMGGRRTLVGDPFRAWGGRRAVLVRVEWQAPVPVPAISLGPFASTGRQATLAPYVALGWTGAPVPGTPRAATDGLRPVFGVSAELFHRLLRADVGWSPRARRVGLTIDVRRELWPIL